MPVIIDDALVKKLAALVKILLKEGYFIEEQNAIDYVKALVAFIKKIPTEQWYKTKNLRYGEWYSRYKPNRRTTWYFTFHEYDGQIFVLHAFNNHSPKYPSIIFGNK